jgi:hypothetical protein
MYGVPAGCGKLWAGISVYQWVLVHALHMHNTHTTYSTTSVLNPKSSGFVFSIDLSGNYTCLMCKKDITALRYTLRFSRFPSPAKVGSHTFSLLAGMDPSMVAQTCKPGTHGDIWGSPTVKVSSTGAVLLDGCGESIQR